MWALYEEFFVVSLRIIKVMDSSIALGGNILFRYDRITEKYTCVGP